MFGLDLTKIPIAAIGLVILTLIAALATFGGDACRKGDEPLIRRITMRGWVLLSCLILTALVGTSKEYADASEASDRDGQIRTLQGQLDKIGLTADDLAALNSISGKQKYYVKLAVGTDYCGLKRDTLDKVNNQFGGVFPQNQLCIYDSKSKTNPLVAVFGDGLDLAAAAVFMRLADDHGLASAGDKGQPPRAFIEPEPGPVCPIKPTPCLKQDTRSGRSKVPSSSHREGRRA